MLDINLIRENPEAVRQALLKRMDSVDFTELLLWDKQRREFITQVGLLREKRNTVSGQIPKMKKAGEDTTSLQQEMKEVSNQIKTIES
ncbi:MAG: serine--tRNA ligase, partial [Candidatus Latescibacterota bacterium]